MIGSHSRLFVCSLVAIAGALALTRLSSAQTPPAAAPAGNLSVEQKVELAIRKIEAQDLKEAERLINEAMIEKPNLHKLWLARGLFHVATKSFVEAISELEKYNDPKEVAGDYRGYAAAGQLYVRSKMYSSARPVLERARDFAGSEKVDGKPVKAQILINLATAHIGLANNKEAVKTVREAQTLAPDDGDILLSAAEISAQAQDAQAASAAVEQAILLFKNDLRDDPFNLTAHDKLRQAYSIAMRLYEAERYRDPENAEPYYRAARLTVSAAEIERRMKVLDAIRVINQSIERAPKNNDFKLYLVELEYSLGGLKDGRARLDEILAADPENSRAKEWKTKLESSPPRLNLP